MNPTEWNANYGQILIVWDRLFRTYVGEPAGGDTRLKTGTDAIGTNDFALARLLMSPLH